MFNKLYNYDLINHIIKHHYYYLLWKATNMASNQLANIPRKHQVIIDEMMTGETGDVGDILMQKEGKQGFIFDDMLKEEESKQGICSSYMSEVAGTQGVIFIEPKVFLDRTFQKHVRKRRVITQVHGIAKVSNRTLGDLQFVRGDEWAKRTIPQGGHVSFVTKNSRGHVIYDGTNVQGGPHHCAWLLAWCVHSDGYGNQVCINLVLFVLKSIMTYIHVCINRII